MTSFLVNEETLSLKPYPMEALSRIRTDLVKRGIKVFDFGTGDPKIPCWPAINEKLVNAIPKISQYPSARGGQELIDAQWTYLSNRFALKKTPDIELAATRGSKEAVFHIALSIVGRAGGKRTIIFPDPGYPVYASSCVFAQAKAYPVELRREQGFLLKPWELQKSVQEDAAAIWINYPHNPTGATATLSYWQELIAWAHKHDCLILSDDCYIDIYDAELDHREHHPENLESETRPICPLSLTSDRVICLFSLSKRSGLTGYRSGFMAGDARFMKPHLEARANFGVGSPQFIEAASAFAWQDEKHVAERRKIFSQRIKAASVPLIELGLIDEAPLATFYLWCKIPNAFNDDDVGFCLKLAEKGVITSPSQWLSIGVKGYFRIALVPDEAETRDAMKIMQDFIKSGARA